ncbi:MAG: hypothetical protein LC130_28500 [Bryobacterales bacterium]|nr:hypothetical protein [Bryobacterales bacterium]
MNERYEVGDVMRLHARFTSAGVDVDPETVVFKAMDPAGQVQTWTYGTDPEVVKLGTGHYQLDLPLTDGGTWYYRVEGQGAYQSADEQQFVVRESAFA